MMTFQTKLLRVLLALLIWGLFANAAGADTGAAYYLFRSMGEMKEIVTAGLIAWLAYPFLADLN